MSEKKYTVVCNGTMVEVTKEVYRLYITEPENEARNYRRRKKGVIKVDNETETVDCITCPEDSIERLMELGHEFEDTSFSIDALDTAVMVDRALDELSFEERYIIVSTLDKLSDLMDILDEHEVMTEFDETVFGLMTEKMTAMSEKEVVFRLIGGVEFTETVERR